MKKIRLVRPKLAGISYDGRKGKHTEDYNGVVLVRQVDYSRLHTLTI